MHIFIGWIRYFNNTICEMTMHFAMNNQDFKAWSEFFFFLNPSIKVLIHGRVMKFLKIRVLIDFTEYTRHLAYVKTCLSKLVINLFSTYMYV